MSDRISLVVAVPVDDALPPDVQGVGLRRLALDRMKEIATVDENTLRYKGFSESASISTGADVRSVWQMNQIAFRFIADGEAKEGVIGPVTHDDKETRVWTSVAVNRNEYAR